MYISSISDSVWGTIPIKLSTRAKRIIFKASQEGLYIVHPAHSSVNEAYLKNLVEENRQALQRVLSRVKSRTEVAKLFDGKIIKTEECEIHITSDNSLKKNCVKSTMSNGILYILFSASNDITNADYSLFVSQFIARQLRRYYGHILIELVNHYAQLYHLKVNNIRIGRGRRILGHCSRKGDITISSYVLFFPQHLRRYIVCHELAHLTHFNHSTQFHQLCDLYCEGNEQKWSRESNKFAFPII